MQPIQLSVLLPVYNSAAYLREALESLQAQTFSAFEVLILYEPSSDQTRAIATEICQNDSRFRIVEAEKKGLASALNQGLREARADWIARADADDINLPERFALQMRYLRAHPEIVLLGSAYEVFNGSQVLATTRHPTRPFEIARKMLGNTKFGHPCVIYSKSLALLLGGYPYCEAEDFALFAKLLREGPTSNLPQVLVRYRSHGGNKSSNFMQQLNLSICTQANENFAFFAISEALAASYLRMREGPGGGLRTRLRAFYVEWKVLCRLRPIYSLPFSDFLHELLWMLCEFCGRTLLSVHNGNLIRRCLLRLRARMNARLSKSL